MRPRKLLRQHLCSGLRDWQGSALNDSPVVFRCSGQLLTCLGTDFHRGAGVLDVFYETPSLLLSCGYDTYIRYWDIRTSTR